MPAMMIRIEKQPAGALKLKIVSKNSASIKSSRLFQFRFLEI